MSLRGVRVFLVGASVLALGMGSTYAVAATRDASPHPAVGTPALAAKGAAERVRQLVQCGGTMYAVGTFTEISQNGTVYPRNNVFSFSATDPFTMTSWNPDVNGTVNTIAFNGANCADAYIGGQFSSVDGAAVKNIAEIDTTTGALVPGFRHDASGPVETILAVNGHLLAGGRFRGINGSAADPYYASLSPATGEDDGFVDLGISGHYRYKGVRSNSTEVYNQQLSPDGALVLVEGDFTLVGGLPRQQIFMINVTGRAATVTGWSSPAWDGSDPTGGGQYDRYWQCSDDQPFYIQDAAWSPDGSTIYLATTGDRPWRWNARFPLVGLCDSVSAISSQQEENPPISWTNYTGCGSLYTVAAASSAVFVAGDEQWADNPDGCKHAGPGSVKAPGMAGFTAGGMLLLNARGTAGLYSRSPGPADLLLTDAGLWIGGGTSRSGTSCDGASGYAGICFLPYP
jgi:hypothetical protein